jgi:hypothetical protein
MNLRGFDPVTVWLLNVKDLEVAIPSRAVQHLPCRFQSIVLRIVLFRLKPSHWRIGVFVPGVQFPFHGGHSDGAASLPETRERAPGSATRQTFIQGTRLLERQPARDLAHDRNEVRNGVFDDTI